MWTATQHTSLYNSQQNSPEYFVAQSTTYDWMSAMELMCSIFGKKTKGQNIALYVHWWV